MLRTCGPWHVRSCARTGCLSRSPMSYPVTCTTSPAPNSSTSRPPPGLQPDLGRISFGGFDEAPGAEQGAAEVGEGLEMLGFAVVAAHEAAVALQPGQAGLDDPAVPAQPLGGLDALAGDAHHDAASAYLAA